MHFEKPKEQELKSGAMNLDLNKLMQNVGSEHFTFDSFKASYDADPRVKALIADFTERGIEPKTKKAPTNVPQGDKSSSKDSVGAMAKRATNLSNNKL